MITVCNSSGDFAPPVALRLLAVDAGEVTR